ncbi:hypothetical protein AALA00_07615 [Lachnospiraceae bacterium 46-15]
MDRKKTGAVLNLELLGGIAGLVLIVCSIAAFLDIDNMQGFFVLVSGLGVLVNGILAGLKLLRKKYISGIILAFFAAALLVLFVLQLLMAERLLG